MNLDSFRAQLEEEQAWRIEEILFFQNHCASIHDEMARKKFRRALILLLYSNFEGFCQFALSLYLSCINLAQVKCSEANWAIAASSLSDVFEALRNPEKKAPEFKSILPDDSKLHRFSRDREFVEKAIEIMQRTVVLPDSIVDTESNLKPAILRKNLFRLGLPFEQFESLEGDIRKLLGFRNRIAHGATRLGIGEKIYVEMRDAAFRIMSDTAVTITRAYHEKWYLKHDGKKIDCV
ncbi:MAE_28990/MAE_18760 family HEPN-like nuclease [Burkholderia ubonensis]|uniref:MAE_28990/MAE_18760 family HEPN-like nuclease n=1 Tax=Burkholderia ubonensis TaxID=101571 RepID=UPI000ACC3B3A|nr:MAE_28990/MAE_18760 family HEPN-like nuclease [Burkholderia ubonensis]